MRRLLVAAIVTGLSTTAISAATASQAGAPTPATPANAHVHQTHHDLGTGTPSEDFTFEPGVGPTRRGPGGLLEVRLRDGSIVTTHGADPPAAHPNTTLAPTPREATPACASTDRTFVFYAAPRDKAYRYDGTMISRLRTYTRQVTGEIRDEGLASSGNTKGPLLKVACNSDGSIRVGGIHLATTLSTSDSFDSIVSDMQAAGWNAPGTKYLIFYDDPIPNKCGQGQLEQDDRKTTDNASNVGTSYAVVYGNTSTYTCWDWFSATHELFHTMGAVQNTAPYSSGAGHCNDGYDVMCYADGGPKSSYSTSYCSRYRLDCRFDTYYDTATESGEWLASHWNIGWSGNYYLRF